MPGLPPSQTPICWSGFALGLGELLGQVDQVALGAMLAKAALVLNRAIDVHVTCHSKSLNAKYLKRS